ncbi:hypothetical protein BKH42_02140 [Helicobacter sp. 13S00482-2]|uniref:restriction endonuclease subunit S n=1 Tax=Helicobacter sp. 13S00482-2 TaxID=1476200 RepID=UPI000BA7A537|nr:restriction endonuclease subunit S [Helicobacter sp. 13S00482-2]PAF54324.1 hypothetical protein BKH42_02140 [Helicobacter sp. 13S00482-2]
MNVKNNEGVSTITISNKEFYGIVLGSEYWGVNFDSVTSENNFDYKIISKNQIAYNPSRANVGSIGINVTNNSYSVSKMYITFEIYNPEYLPEYVYLFLKSSEGIEEIRTRSFGAVRQILRFEDLTKITIPKIPLSEQNRICHNARNKYKRFIDAKKELESFEVFDS